MPRFAVVKRSSIRKVLKFSKASFVSSEICNSFSTPSRVSAWAISVCVFTFATRTASKEKSFKKDISSAPPSSRGFVLTMMKLFACFICERKSAMFFSASFLRLGAIASSRFRVIISAGFSSILLRCLRLRGLSIILLRRF